MKLLQPFLSHGASGSDRTGNEHIAKGMFNSFGSKIRMVFSIELDELVSFGKSFQNDVRDSLV